MAREIPDLWKGLEKYSVYDATWLWVYALDDGGKEPDPNEMYKKRIYRLVEKELQDMVGTHKEQRYLRCDDSLPYARRVTEKEYIEWEAREHQLELDGDYDVLNSDEYNSVFFAPAQFEYFLGSELDAYAISRRLPAIFGSIGNKNLFLEIERTKRKHIDTPVSVGKETHPNWLYPDVAGEAITLDQLRERWNVNKRFLWMLGVSGDLMPWQGECAGWFHEDTDGRIQLYFLPTETQTNPPFPGDFTSHKEIPDDATYYLPNIRQFEERNPRVLKGTVEYPNKLQNGKRVKKGVQHKPKPRRVRQIRIAVSQAINILREKHKREPTADQIFQHLKNEDETGIIVDSRPPDLLMWQDKKGKIHDIKYKTIANMVSSIRNESAPA